MKKLLLIFALPVAICIIAGMAIYRIDVKRCEKALKK
jgi:CHASE3 domain sensor protein